MLSCRKTQRQGRSDVWKDGDAWMPLVKKVWRPRVRHANLRAWRGADRAGRGFATDILFSAHLNRAACSAGVGKRRTKERVPARHSERQERNGVCVDRTGRWK